MPRTLYRIADDGGKHDRPQTAILRALAEGSAAFVAEWGRLPTRFGINQTAWDDISSKFPGGSGRGIARVFFEMTPVIDNSLGDDEFEVVD